MKFHAAAEGAWINDPNALVRWQDQYLLFALFRPDVPTFAQTGWARFSSPDLLHWSPAQVVIKPEPAAWAYSGSLVCNGTAFEIAHTQHACSDGAQSQWHGFSNDGGLSWQRHELTSIPPHSARRDPFLFRVADGSWRMLLARPCPWTDWEEQPASYIETWRSGDRENWELVGTFGPLDERGVLWEVPLLIFDRGEASRCALIVSKVDRRGGRSLCSVEYWPGSFNGVDFEATGASRRLDLGPDFYAAMVNVREGWGSDGTTLVGWASSWESARAVSWPGFFGGPISLPRRLEWAEGRLVVRAEPSVVDAFSIPVRDAPKAGMGSAAIPGDLDFELTIGSEVQLRVEGDPKLGTIKVQRNSLAPQLRWAATHQHVLRKAAERVLRLFVDGPLVELFIEPDGIALTATVPPDTLPVAALSGRTPVDVRWSCIDG